MWSKNRKVSKFNAEETKIWTTQLRTLQSFKHGHQLNVTDFKSFLKVGAVIRSLHAWLFQLLRGWYFPIEKAIDHLQYLWHYLMNNNCLKIKNRKRKRSNYPNNLRKLWNKSKKKNSAS